MNDKEDKNLRKISLAARVPGALVWNPAKFEIQYEAGSIIVEVNQSNRSAEEQNAAAKAEAERILRLLGRKLIVSVRRIPVWSDL